MSAADVSARALRLTLDGDVPAAFAVMTDHLAAVDHPRQEMFTMAWGFASVCDDQTGMLSGLSDDAAGLALSMIGAARTDDMSGAWMVWQMARAGEAGAALGGLLAVAAASVLRRMT